MKEKSYLIFRLHDLLYGIETSLVKEIFQLPEISPIPEAPPDIIGILNLRGTILPIMHLDRRLGQPIQECTPSDSVIVIEWHMIQVGIVINEVLDVQTIPNTFIETEPDYGREKHINTAFISGIATVADKTIILLNSEALIRHPNEVAMLAWGTEVEPEAEIDSETLQPEKILRNFYELYSPQATTKDKRIFRQRAEGLTKSLEDLSATVTLPLTVFSLGEEYFAFDLEIVKELIDIPHITPIPCCPDYIVGNINLRGQIVTLVDLRPILLLEKGNRDNHKQAIVVEIDDIKAGIVVDEIFDVLYLDQEQFSSTPTAVASSIKPYLKGTAPYKSTMLTRIDLVRIMAEDRLLVNQNI
ncbi:MAG: chemotaxis protein CheW [Xenococcaceae cyanobacterium MO_207.B15]|nr:chemotaxis protein CheW [Xenococcaceae cyanobacterium MO_207.B15]